MKTLALTLFTCYIAGVGGLLTNHVVMFGDSYSDSGDGFAKYAQYVLRTNAVRPEALFPSPGVFPVSPQRRLSWKHRQP